MQRCHFSHCPGLSLIGVTQRGESLPPKFALPGRCATIRPSRCPRTPLSETPLVKSRVDARIEALLRETEGRLRRQNQVLVDLARRPSIHAGDITAALRDITEAAAYTLE